MDIYLVETITNDGRFFKAFKHLNAARNYQNKMKENNNVVNTLTHIVPMHYDTN